MAPTLSIIFVAGAYHNNYHVLPLAPYLEAFGYRLVPVRLWTSCREKEDPTLEDNVGLIKQVIVDEVNAGNNVCLTAHSVAGQSSALALNEYLSTASAAQKAQLKQVIYIACLFDNVRLDQNVNWYRQIGSTWWFEVPDPKDCFYNDMSAEDAQPFIDALGACRATIPPENLSPEWRKATKTAYFLCLKDRAVPPHIQRLEADESEMPIVELDTDHCPSVSKPKVLADAMHQVLSRL